MGNLITATDLRRVFFATFPGAKLEESSHMNGAAFKAPIWDFSVEASLTLRTLADTDKVSETILTFRFSPPNRRPMILAQTSVDTLADVELGLEELRQRLMGIVATIVTACETPPPRPRHSIFD
jgi:hypothetical protein